MSKPTVGIFGLTGCAGDQLAILDCEDELLRIVELVDLKDFLMASSANDGDCRLDVALVEGAVASERDDRRLRRIRERSDLLGALGTCAAWGGVAAMDRGFQRAALAREIYGAAADGYDARPARALNEVVEVDFAIPGCPVEKHEVLEALASLLRGDLPVAAAYPVCVECRAQENPCLFRKEGVACFGPLTAGGCDARCPAHGVPCFGCRGPAPDANIDSWTELVGRHGIVADEAARKLGTFAPLAARNGRQRRGVSA